MTINFLACRTSPSGNIITPKGRLSFAQYILKKGKPKNAPAGQEEKYSTSLLIPKTADLTLLREAIVACAKGKYGANVPKGLKFPILEAFDADKSEKDQYEGYTKDFWLIRPTSKQKPGVVDASGKHVGDDAAASEIYSGRWACVSLNPFPYDFGKPGIGLGLQNVQLLENDESLGGRARAEDEFEPVEGAAGPADGAGPTEDNPFG